MDCDIIDTELCKHYQKRYACMYGNTHGVKECPYGKLDYYYIHYPPTKP